MLKELKKLLSADNADALKSLYLTSEVNLIPPSTSVGAPALTTLLNEILFAISCQEITKFPDKFTFVSDLSHNIFP